MRSPSIELARSIALLDPVPQDAEADLEPLTAHELSVLAAIKRGEALRRRTPVAGLRRLALPTLATAMAATALIVALPLAIPTAATAMTPPALEYRALAASADDVLADARAQLAASDAGESVRGVAYSGWFLQVDPAESAQGFILPQNVSLAWSADLSGQQTITAGVAYVVDLAGSDATEIPIEGTVLAEMTFAAGELVVPDRDAPGQTEAEMESTLGSYAASPLRGDAGTIIDATDALMSLWTLTDAQQSAVLAVLDAGEGLTVLGAATDRQGRDVIALEAAADGAVVAKTILISQDTGRIVGVETTQRTDDVSVQSGDVISYRLWKDQP